MTQKAALILSAVLTAFVLVVGGGIIARASHPEAAPTTVPVFAAPAAVDAAAQVQELVAQRDAQYRQLIDEANRRLQTANEQLAAAQSRLASRVTASAAPAAPASPAPAAAPQIALSPESARDIAVQAANFATMIRTPELVRFEGKVAYEIGFTRGVVYIDANTGEVLFNGTQGSGGGTSAAPPPSSSGGEHETEHENEQEHAEEHGSGHD